MGPLRPKAAARAGAIACAIVLALTPGAHAANSDYDNLNGVTLGDTPYTSVMPFVAPVQSFDNAAFGADPEYSAGAPTYGACQAWGWRSAWVRFATAVKGRVFVTVDSSTAPAYDSFYTVYTAPTSIPPGSASMAQLSQVECQNANVGMPNEDYTFGHEIEANRTIYVQVMSVCANRTELPAAPHRRRRTRRAVPPVSACGSRRTTATTTRFPTRSTDVPARPGR